MYIGRYRRLCNLKGLFFLNDTTTTDIYTLSLHDALPIWATFTPTSRSGPVVPAAQLTTRLNRPRSEEHTSELQSQSKLVCRLLLEKKKEIQTPRYASV